MNKNQLESRLHREIPLSQFMQVKVMRVDDVQVELQCDLEPNHNHLGTAFGGSLSCLMILAAYCQVFRLINEKQGHVVLKASSMECLLPVAETLKAVCKPPTSEEIQSFLKTYDKKGRARLFLQSEIILENGQTACKMNTEFVGTH